MSLKRKEMKYHINIVMIFCKILVQECAQTAYKTRKTLQGNSEAFTVYISLAFPTCSPFAECHCGSIYSPLNTTLGTTFEFMVDSNRIHTFITLKQLLFHA